jgi:hypothetical protein
MKHSTREFNGSEFYKVSFFMKKILFNFLWNRKLLCILATGKYFLN